MLELDQEKLNVELEKLFNAKFESTLMQYAYNFLTLPLKVLTGKITAYIITGLIPIADFIPYAYINDAINSSIQITKTLAVTMIGADQCI